MNPDKKLVICKRTRKFAADSLLITLKKLFTDNKPISETLLRDTWLAEFRKNPDIFPDGWYTPPPHGMIVLFADDEKIDRANYKSARPPEFWPQENIYLNKSSGIISAYSSPVDISSGIIGDFGITLYFGKKSEIQNHLKLALKINNQIFEQINTGQDLSEVSKTTHKILHRYNLLSNLLSPTDPTGTNTGHTIPASYENWNEIEVEAIKNGKGDWEKVCKLISQKRKFVNTSEQLITQPGIAFTIEPRPQNTTNPNLPMVLFHEIVTINSKGEKELLANFNDLFKFAGMKYMLNE